MASDMPLLHPQQPLDQRTSPGLTINLPTNNPFRRGPASPPLIPALNTPAERPRSRNPFLDSSEMEADRSRPRPSSPRKGGVGGPAVPVRLADGAGSEMGHNKSVSAGNFTPNGTGHVMGPPRTANGAGNKPFWPENIPSQAGGRVMHRPSRSQEEEQRMRTMAKPRGLGPTLDIFAESSEAMKPHTGRPRRNSDSSLVDRNNHPLDPEEDRKRRERRHREREARHRDSKGRPIPTPTSKSKKPVHRLDIIDKLDVTSIYGTGLFHHDGPFDACNPHRNRKGSQRAPMQAFPKDSMNNTIGGSGPINKSINIDQFHGHGAEGFTDYSTSGTVASPVYEPYVGPGIPTRNARPGIDGSTSFNASSKVELLHGDETMGLGTSTFLEGAPAARAAIQRRESEGEAVGGAGLSRKQSLAQKIRGMSNSRSDRSGAGLRGINSPGAGHPRNTAPTEVPNAGGPPKPKESAPVFNDYDEAYEKKGEHIKIAENQLMGTDENTGRLRSPSSPVKEFEVIAERSVTAEPPVPAPVSPPDGEAKTGGFLNRVKSLRGKTKPRMERRETSS